MSRPSPSSRARRVLIVAYYFPPMGLSGVQRIVKFAKYLPSFGWEPTILTVQPGGYYAFDQGLQDEVDAAGMDVHRTPSLDPNRLFGRSRSVRMPGEAHRSRLARLSQFVFVPDNKIGWYPWATRAGLRVLEGSSFDAILSSAPPYTAHLVGARLSNESGIPLVIDYRDDWLDNPRHTYPTRLHRDLHRRLERRVVRSATTVVTINPTIAGALQSRYPGMAPPRVIPQGYDPADYPETVDATASTHFDLIYTGVFYDAQRPDVFLAGVAHFLEQRPDAREYVRARFLGLFPEAGRAVVEKLGLDDVVHVGPYVSHREAMDAVVRSSVAWLVVGRRSGAEQISTGKLYAYMGAARPILALVPDGEARRELEDYGAATVVDPEDAGAVASAIARLFDAWKAGRLPVPNPDVVRRFDRRILTGLLAETLDCVAPEGDRHGSSS